MRLMSYFKDMQQVPYRCKTSAKEEGTRNVRIPYLCYSNSPLTNCKIQIHLSKWRK